MMMTTAIKVTHGHRRRRRRGGAGTAGMDSMPGAGVERLSSVIVVRWLLPSSSGRAMPSGRTPGSQAPQPATELPDQAVTERRRLVAMDGHVGNGEVARAGLNDPAPIVRITALGALERLGGLQLADLVTALADPEPSVRRRACELAAGLPDLDISSSLVDRDPSVVEMAAWAMGEQGSSAVVPALV